MNILRNYNTESDTSATHIGPHNDSEAPMYFDKIIRADMGDVSYVSSFNNIKISILTKGIKLGGLMDLAISKRYYSVNKPSVINVCVSLLECDNKEKNLQMAFDLKEISSLYGASERIGLKIFASPENLIKYAKQIKQIKGKEGILTWAALEPIGRASSIK